MADYAIHDTTLTGISNVIRKKDGTSALIDPADYADRINLMGMLEKKIIVSSPICDFSDGSDDVPTDSVKITLPASLDGYSSVSEKQTGRNLLLPNDADASPVTTNGITRTYSLSGQSFSFNGTNEKTDSAWLVFNGSNFALDGIKKGATYSFYHNLGAGMYAQVTYYNTQGTTRALVNLAGSAGKNNRTTFTVPADFDRLRNFQIGVYAYATTINETDIVFMLATGSTAHDYEPYTAPTTYTADLGRTIYGGEVDIVNGTGTDENGNDFTFTGQEVPTRLGYNAFWNEQGDTEVTYRSSGTITPVTPTLITKTITANGTYSAEDDDADGYSEVTVNVDSGYKMPYKIEHVTDSSVANTFTATEAGNYLCVVMCSYDGTRSISTTGTTIYAWDVEALDGRGMAIELVHLEIGEEITYNATTTNLYNSLLKAVIKLDDDISLSGMVDSFMIADGNTSGYTPSYSGDVLSIAVCGGNNIEHYWDRTIPRDDAFEMSINGGLNSAIHIGWGACPNYNMYGYYGNGVYIALLQ